MIWTFFFFVNKRHSNVCLTIKRQIMRERAKRIEIVRGMWSKGDLDGLASVANADTSIAADVIRHISARAVKSDNWYRLCAFVLSVATELLRSTWYEDHIVVVLEKVHLVLVESTPHIRQLCLELRRNTVGVCYERVTQLNSMVRGLNRLDDVLDKMVRRCGTKLSSTSTAKRKVLSKAIASILTIAASIACEDEPPGA